MKNPTPKKPAPSRIYPQSLTGYTYHGLNDAEGIILPSCSHTGGRHHIQMKSPTKKVITDEIKIICQYGLSAGHPGFCATHLRMKPTKRSRKNGLLKALIFAPLCIKTKWKEKNKSGF